MSNEATMGAGSCYGTHDISFDACTPEVCAMSERCRIFTLSLSSGKSVSEKTEKKPEPLPEMEPLSYLMECMKGRFDLNTLSKITEEGNMKIHRFMKNGVLVARIFVLESGKMKIETKNEETILEKGLGSVAQAHSLYKAFFV